MSKTLELCRELRSKPFGPIEQQAVLVSFARETIENPVLEALALRLAELGGLNPPRLAPLYIRQALEIAALPNSAAQFVAEIEDLF